jgi:hypothetical protein
MDDIIARLLNSNEPCIRYKTLVNVLGMDPEGPEARQVREAIPSSPRILKLLSQRQMDGRIPGNPYYKFTGAHWILSLLADLGYPPGDTSLNPLRDQVQNLWLSPAHVQEGQCDTRSAVYKTKVGVPIMQGRARRCGSQEGNALYSILALGLADDRTEQLAANLLRWQWPDGGWNCDRNPEADTSSFHETPIPMRGLALHAKLTGSKETAKAAQRASEVFLKRRLFRRVLDGSVIHREFTTIHFPCYWHYDFLYGLKVMTEAGFLQDPRCYEALDVLESKRLPDGGFPAEKKYDKLNDGSERGGTLVDWGPISKRQMNEFVTVDALAVLKSAGRL